MDGREIARIVRQLQTEIDELRRRLNNLPVRFAIPAAADETVVVKLTGAVTGAGGQYYGRILTGVSTADGAGDLAMPEGMTVPAADDALVLNPNEDGMSTHSMTTPCYSVGQVVGDTAGGLRIVVLPKAAGGVEGTGRGKFLGLIDDADPGTQAFEYPFFT